MFFDTGLLTFVYNRTVAWENLILPRGRRITGDGPKYWALRHFIEALRRGLLSFCVRIAMDNVLVLFRRFLLRYGASSKKRTVSDKLPAIDFTAAGIKTSSPVIATSSRRDSTRARYSFNRRILPCIFIAT